MDYNFGGLNTRDFEHLSQSLFLAHIGTDADVFGDGPDGGREATWNGPPGPNSTLPRSWSGPGVFQAKFRQKEFSRVSDARKWFTRLAIEELNDWKTSRPRENRPTHVLFSTNVNLGAKPGSDAKSVEAELLLHAKSLRLAIRGVRVWHGDTLRTLLDNSDSIRVRYLPLIGSGDVFDRLLRHLPASGTERLHEVLLDYVQKTLLDDKEMNLTQAGSVSDAQPSVHELYVDLPAVSSQSRPQASGGVGAMLIETGNVPLSPSLEQPSHGRRHVLVGGPGQGKTTVGQMLCQAHRANLILSGNSARSPELSEIVEQVVAALSRTDMPTVRVVRWPLRVHLPELADFLARNPDEGLIEFATDVVERRTGRNLPEDGMRTWLKTAPWLLVLDGLDELPASGNRSDTLRIIHEFLILADTLDADMLVLMGTRPGNLATELNPDRFNYVNLRALEPEVALGYAQNLLRVRVPEGSDRYRRALSHVERASREPATARLMSSPLQVTILTILIERQGKAPSDRWRLFDQYYRVIYQREQEKGGDVGDLLSEHQHDIDAIHAKTAHRLQVRAETAGEAESTLSAIEFESLIRKHLLEQGYVGTRLDDLTARFNVATTERIVFISTLSEDGFGFEVRSLQEFMAAEFIVSYEPSSLEERVVELAPAIYWRNVMMFLAGKIFAVRQDLRGTLVAACHGLNVASVTARTVQPGSRLALAVLAEGIVDNHPRYKASLTHVASMLLSRPSEAVDELGADCAQLDHEVLLAECDLRARGSNFERLAVFRFLGSPAVRPVLDSDRRQALLTKLKSSVPPEHLAALAWDLHSPDLLEAARDEIELAGPGSSRGISNGPQNWLNHDSHPGTAVRTPGWLSALAAVINRPYSNFEGGSPILLTIREDPALRIRFESLGSRKKVWMTIDDGLPSCSSWDSVRAVAYFNLRPSAQSLAAALKALQDHPSTLASSLAKWSAWPLSSSALAAGRFSGTSGTSDYKEIGDAVSQGMLGDTETWRAAEARLRSDPILSVAQWLEASSGGTVVPFNRGIAEQGAPMNTVVSTNIATVADAYASLDFAKSAVLKLRASERSLQAACVAHSILFEVSRIAHRRQVFSEDVPEGQWNQLMEDCFDVSLELASFVDLPRLDWVIFLSPERSARAESLILEFGARPWIAVSYLPDGPNLCELYSSGGSENWQAARIALFLGQSSVLRVHFTEDWVLVKEPVRRRFLACHSFFTGRVSSGRDLLAEAEFLVDEFAAREEGSAGETRLDSLNWEFVMESPLFLAHLSSNSSQLLALAAQVAVQLQDCDPLMSVRLGGRLAAAVSQLPIADTLVAEHQSTDG